MTNNSTSIKQQVKSIKQIVESRLLILDIGFSSNVRRIQKKANISQKAYNQSGNGVADTKTRQIPRIIKIRKMMLIFFFLMINDRISATTTKLAPIKNDRPDTR
ncbi:MAG: hypothetical protein GY869_22840 [Planctomycetes bacterium]|nr:hypothetical protein [Planctomycetota bacterium]